MTESYRDRLNEIDHKCLDEDLKFYDLRSLFEAVAPKLSAEDKEEIKKVIQNTNDAETIAAVLQAKAMDEKNESLEERYDFDLVDNAIDHFLYDLGRKPEVDDVIEYIENTSPEEVPDDFDKYQKWADDISCEISARLSESLEEELIEDVISREQYEKEREELANKFDELRRNKVSSYDYRYKALLKKEKELNKLGREVKAQEIGGVVFNKSKLTNLIKKLTGLDTLKTHSTAIRGYHNIGSGSFTIIPEGQNSFRLSFYRNRNIQDEVKTKLIDLGFKVSEFGGDLLIDDIQIPRNESLEESFYVHDQSLVDDWIEQDLTFDIEQDGVYSFINASESREALKTARSHGYRDAWRETNKVYISGDKVNESLEEDSKIYDYDEAIYYVESKGINADPTTYVGEYVCDLLDDLAGDNEEYSKQQLDYIIKRAIKIRGGDQELSLEEKLVDTPQEVIDKLIEILGNHGFILDDSFKVNPGKTFMGETHIQVINPDSFIEDSDEINVQDELSKYVTQDLIDEIHELDQKSNCPITWNFGPNKDGQVTGGLDIMKQYVDEKLRETWADEEYNSLMKKGKENWDQDDWDSYHYIMQAWHENCYFDESLNEGYSINYVRSNPYNLDLIYSVSIDPIQKNKKGESYRIVKLYLVCGKDYIDSPYYDGQAWVDAKQFVDDIQFEQIVWYPDDESLEDAFEANDYKVCNKPHSIWHYDEEKDRWYRNNDTKVNEDLDKNKKWKIIYGKGRPQGQEEVVEFPSYKDTFKYASDNAHGWGFEIENVSLSDSLDNHTYTFEKSIEEEYDETPYTYEQMESELKAASNNWREDNFEGNVSYKDEFDSTMDILSKHYENVDSWKKRGKYWFRATKPSIFESSKSLKEAKRLNNKEKEIYINEIKKAENKEDLEDIIHEIFFYDKGLFTMLRHFPKEKSFEELQSKMIEIIQSTILDESFKTKRINYCPHCTNNTLVEVEDGYYICDECGEEYIGYPSFEGGLELEPVDEGLFNEASYGGAYDIEDDMFFTKDDLMEFLQILIDKLDNLFGYSFDVYDAGFDSPTQLYIELIDEVHDININYNFKIDMRKIKKPSDLQRYIPQVFEYFVQKYQEEYDQYNFDESLNEDTIKQNGKWVNKGKERTHGKFATKKAADAQRKAMFANRYNESLSEAYIDADKDILKIIRSDKEYNTNFHVKSHTPDFSAIPDGTIITLKSLNKYHPEVQATIEKISDNNWKYVYSYGDGSWNRNLDNYGVMREIENVDTGAYESLNEGAIDNDSVATIIKNNLKDMFYTTPNLDIIGNYINFRMNKHDAASVTAATIKRWLKSSDIDVSKINIHRERGNHWGTPQDYYDYTIRINEDWNIEDQIDAPETIGKLNTGDKFKNRNGVIITIIEPQKDGTIQYKIGDEVRAGSEKSIQQMLYRNNYIREDIYNESLNEADTLAKPVKKDIKNSYKYFDRKRDFIRKKNAEKIKRIDDLEGSKEDKERVKDYVLDKEPKFKFNNNYDGLETKHYPYYVTYYVEVPYYHPEEGGYYVAGMSAEKSQGFDSKQEAIKAAEQLADELNMQKIGPSAYQLESRYIGDSEYIYVETSRNYLSKQKGDQQYESLKEDYQHKTDEWGEPYSYDEVERELKSITNNWTDKEGTIRCYWEQEKNYGLQILNKYYKYVETSDGRTGKGEDMSWVLAYSGLKEE